MTHAWDENIRDSLRSKLANEIAETKRIYDADILTDAEKEEIKRLFPPIKGEFKCLFCGKIEEKTRKGFNKRFCSDLCRKLYKKKKKIPPSQMWLF